MMATGGQRMKRLIDRLENTMNDFNLKKKLHILYIYCMLIPLIITDSVILFIVAIKKSNN